MLTTPMLAGHSAESSEPYAISPPQVTASSSSGCSAHPAARPPASARLASASASTCSASA